MSVLEFLLTDTDFHLPVRISRSNIGIFFSGHKMVAVAVSPEGSSSILSCGALSTSTSRCICYLRLRGSCRQQALLLQATGTIATGNREQGRVFKEKGTTNDFIFTFARGPIN
ncbi:MAG: hypothetical protein SXA11_20800 [Cyanobacteriota bacterium]|nr:hypothetical protein [Cyanobacteriota bacterium]